MRPPPGLSSDNHGALAQDTSGFSSRARLAWEGKSDGRNREPFPLPSLSTYVVGAVPHAQGGRRCLGKRLQANGRINDISAALNSLAEGGPRRTVRGPVPSLPPLAAYANAPLQSQRSILKHLAQSVQNDPFPDVVPRGDAALRELLKTRGEGYDASRGAVAQYFTGGPSLPSSAVACIPGVAPLR